MQPGGGAAAAARLHDLPDFPTDGSEQQQDGRRVDQQQGDNDPVRRRQRRQIRQDDKGGKGRAQRQTDSDRTQQPGFDLGRRDGRRPSHGWRCGSRGFDRGIGGIGGIGAGHGLRQTTNARLA
jgi:hypothetical protein